MLWLNLLIFKMHRHLMLYNGQRSSGQSQLIVLEVTADLKLVYRPRNTKLQLLRRL